jgi:hypothetical protein
MDEYVRPIVNDSLTIVREATGIALNAFQSPGDHF